VLNLARKALENKTRFQHFVERLPRPVASVDPSEKIAGAEKAQRIIQALDTLDEGHREIVALYYLEGVKIDLISRMVDRPPGTVKRMLAEARSELRKELIEMAREELDDYRLTGKQRERLAKIAEFPHKEPKISIQQLDRGAPQIRAVAAYGTFAPLCGGGEAGYANYDHPGGKLRYVCHAVVEGPIDVQGEPALRVNDLDFDPNGKAEWQWMPYFRVKDDTYTYCAKQCGSANKALQLVTPDHPDWGESQPSPESLIIEPGFKREPASRDDGLDWYGLVVDGNLYEVKIGKRLFTCVRRTGGGAKWKVKWSDSPVTCCATEEFFLEDGRLLLWRRYNGMKWSEKDPNRKSDAPGTYERLAEAGMPSLEVFGGNYYLWYDQIPDYALHE